MSSADLVTWVVIGGAVAIALAKCCALIGAMLFLSWLLGKVLR